MRGVQIQGNFDDGMNIVKEMAESARGARQFGESVPITGKKPRLSKLSMPSVGPDYHSLPVGNAGNISAYWMGYGEYAERGRTNSRPYGRVPSRRRCAVCSRFTSAQPETLATAIRIGNPQSWDLAMNASRSPGDGSKLIATR